MSDRARFVLDTNVLVDAFCFPRSFGRQTYALVVRLGEFVVSRATFDEFEAVMLRPKFERFLALGERRLAVASVARDVTWIEPWCHYRVCRDPTDDKFIDLAVCAGTAAISTRDADLLTLKPFNGIPIEDAKTFVLAHSQDI